MSAFYLYALVLISVTTLISLLLSFKWKGHFPHTTGMIVSMFLAMNVGLTAGITLATVYQGNLFLSTIGGIIFGILAGSFCGVCFGLLSFIEGLMSGLMGGMMGAMLGEMIAIEHAIIFIKFFLFMSMCTIFLLIILSTPSKAIIKNKGWLIKPFLTSILIGSALFLGNLFNMEKVESKHISHNHEQDTNTKSKIETEIQDIVIKTSGMSYLPNKFVIKKNLPITLRLKNSDQIEHDIEIKASSFKIASDSTHQHESMENVIHLHAKPLTTSEITFSINEVGAFEFYCTIPGHKQSGMVGQLVVK